MSIPFQLHSSLGECKHVLNGHTAAVRCVKYNGEFVVSGGYDWTVKVWCPLTAECLYTLQGHANRVYSLEFDGERIISGSLDTIIKVLSIFKDSNTGIWGNSNVT